MMDWRTLETSARDAGEEAEDEEGREVYAAMIELTMPGGREE